VSHDPSEITETFMIIFSVENSFMFFCGNHHTLWNMLGCFNPIWGKIWTNPAIGLHF